MAESTGSVMKGITNSMSLMAFAKSHGKMSIVPCVSESGDHFKSCAFTSPADGAITFVAFSSKMGELSAAEIVSMKDDLQVVQLESGTYKLCKRGADAWEDVDLF